MRRIIALVLSALAVGTVAVVAATPAAAATCGSYLHVHKAPPSGSVLFGIGNQIGAESFTGSTLRINRFSFYSHIAHSGTTSNWVRRLRLFIRTPLMGRCALIRRVRPATVLSVTTTGMRSTG